MIYVVITFFIASVILYTLLGGADFGAGILELFAGRDKKQKVREAVTHAMAPIWEANHIWLIIAVVILFNGFPLIFVQLTTSLHIPILIMLTGIVLRGTTFTFRHYNAYPDKSQEFYSVIFSISSLMVAIGFGVLIAAVIGGGIQPEAMDFKAAYIDPWFTLFGHATGLFIACLFAFLAAVFLIGETSETEMKVWFCKATRYSLIAMLIAGLAVFVGAIQSESIFFERFISNVWSINALVLATLVVPIIWWLSYREGIWPIRFAAGAIVVLVTGAFFVAIFPDVILLRDGSTLGYFNAAAPDITQYYLGVALLGGSVLILPSLWYLFKVFKLD